MLKERVRFVVERTWIRLDLSKSYWVGSEQTALRERLSREDRSIYWVLFSSLSFPASTSSATAWSLTQSHLGRWGPYGCWQFSWPRRLGAILVSWDTLQLICLGYCLAGSVRGQGKGQREESCESERSHPHSLSMTSKPGGRFPSLGIAFHL